MLWRKISLRNHEDKLVGNTVETRAIICGVLSTGSAGITVDFMRQSLPIIDAVEAASSAQVDHVVIPYTQWILLCGSVNAYRFSVGGRAVLAAIDDIINAEEVDAP